MHLGQHIMSTIGEKESHILCPTVPLLLQFFLTCTHDDNDQALNVCNTKYSQCSYSGLISHCMP